MSWAAVQHNQKGRDSHGDCRASSAAGADAARCAGAGRRIAGGRRTAGLRRFRTGGDRGRTAKSCRRRTGRPGCGGQCACGGRAAHGNARAKDAGKDDGRRGRQGGQARTEAGRRRARSGRHKEPDDLLRGGKSAAGGTGSAGEAGHGDACAEAVRRRAAAGLHHDAPRRRRRPLRLSRRRLRLQVPAQEKGRDDARHACRARGGASGRS